MNFLKFETSGPVAVVTMDWPSSHNALASDQQCKEIEDACHRISSDRSIRAVVIDAEAAKACGLVAKVVADEELLPEAMGRRSGSRKIRRRHCAWPNGLCPRPGTHGSRRSSNCLALSGRWPIPHPTTNGASTLP